VTAITLIVIWLGISILTAELAIAKKRNGVLWLFVGMFLGVFALLAIIGMPEKRNG